MEHASKRIWFRFYLPMAISTVDLDSYIQKDMDKVIGIYDGKRAIKWIWQSLDNISIKSPLGGRRPEAILLIEAN